MAADPQSRIRSGPSRRRARRYEVQVPLDITVLRSGVPDTVPGRSVNLSERGLAAMMAGELPAGESVGIELRLPMMADSVQARALVKYQDKLRCGLEFLGLTAEQRAAIRDWVKGSKPEAENTVIVTAAAKKWPAEIPQSSPPKQEAKPRLPKWGPPNTWAGIIVLVLFWFAVAAAILWWRWDREWDVLESGLKNDATTAAERPQIQVPAEVMERLVTHRVEPVYPAEARQQNLQGIIALDIVVGRDGSVARMRALNGPDVLAKAAMDALRWWRFEPYRVNGEPAVVETTVAVEFKP